jgi:hypothetical protein
MTAGLAALAVALASAHGAAAAVDPPLLVPWSRIGDIALGAPKARVQREYGSAGHGFHVLQRFGLPGGGVAEQGYYRRHGGRVVVSFYGDRVGELGFATRYYRTTSGFGVGSTIPLGRCHRTGRNPCEHRWHGFVYNAWSKGAPCHCWVKVGLGAKSLPIGTVSFGKPWFFIYTRRGRVARFYFALEFID